MFTSQMRMLLLNWMEELQYFLDRLLEGLRISFLDKIYFLNGSPLTLQFIVIMIVGRQCFCYG